MSLQVVLAGPQKIGVVPHGTRVVAPISSGHFEGPTAPRRAPSRQR